MKKIKKKKEFRKNAKVARLKYKNKVDFFLSFFRTGIV